MKVLLICALVAVASSQFATRPAEVILQRQGNRAILRVPENFQFGDHAIQLIQGGAPGGGGQGSFQQSQQRSHFQQAEAARFRQQQQQQQQAAAAAAAAAAAERFQQSQREFQTQQQQQQQQVGQRAPFQPSTILAGAGQGAQVSSNGVFTRTPQQQPEVSQQIQQQQQQQQQVQLQAQQQKQQQQQQQQQLQDQYVGEVHGVFEPLNLPSGASLLLGQVSTEFSCNNRPYGYYGDDTNNCRVFHICYPALFSSGVIETYQYSFMCGEGTQFDQKEMACVSYEAALPCIETQNYYIRNAEFGLPHEKTK